MTTETVDALIGALLPFVVGFITTQKLEQSWKDLAAGLCILVAALARCFVANELDLSSLGAAVATIGVVYKAAEQLYGKYVIPKLEAMPPIVDPKPLVPTVDEPGHPDNPKS